nr:hypothetical transcript [Hymenolepis microstoma]
MDLLPGIEKSTQDGDVILAYYTTERMNNQWTTVLVFEKSNGEDHCSVLCEHNTEFDPMKTEFKPTKAYVGTITTIGCKRGFYPKISNSSSQINFACVGEREHPDEANPFNYQAYFELIPNLPPLECKEVSCEFSAETLCNTKEGSINPPNQINFKYGEKATAECGTGFVYVFDKTSKTATMQCVSLYEASSQGVWNPGPCGACTPIRCNETEMISMVPKRASLAEARSTLTEAQFGPSQQNMFNQFGNVVTIMCHDAFYYPDHSYRKFIACGLKSNSETEGEWIGYGGTSLPLPVECERKFTPETFTILLISPLRELSRHYVNQDRGYKNKKEMKGNIE